MAVDQQGDDPAETRTSLYSLTASKVDHKDSIPVPAIFTTTLISILLGLISIGSPTAFNDLVSLAVSGLYASYLIACVLLLWRRSTGFIRDIPQEPIDGIQPININLSDSSRGLVWGPWKMPEVFGKVVNVFACIYLTIVFFFSFWPPVTPVTPATMKYAILVMGFVAIASCLYYSLRAFKTYKGPVVEVELPQ